MVDAVDLRPDQVRRLLIMAAEPRVAQVTIGKAHENAAWLIDSILDGLRDIGVTLAATLTVPDGEVLPDA